MQFVFAISNRLRNRIFSCLKVGKGGYYVGLRLAHLLQKHLARYKAISKVHQL